MEFVGRVRELRMLSHQIEALRRGEGRCVLLRGRRRVGKSRLAEALCQMANVPSVFFTAAGVGVRRELEAFRQAVLESDLPDRAVFDGVTLDSWSAALRLLDQALPVDTASIVVLDEFPYLAKDEPTIEGELQRVWDRWLSRRPTLLILIGSDLSMMEALDSHERPFHQRGAPMVLDPLNPAEVGAMTGLVPQQAFDAYLITGGLPVICRTWPAGLAPREALGQLLAEPISPLVVTGERILAAEFPVEAQARLVLGAIGSDERTRAGIGQATSGMAAASLTRALDLLRSKRVVAGELPLSTQPSRETRYRIADPYLKFWLRFVFPYLAEIDRGRPDRLLARIDAGWTSWRGRAIESVVREALRRLRPIPGLADLPPTAVVGGYWTRSNDVEIDLVGADRAPVAGRIFFAGSVKWRDRTAADARDLAALIATAPRVPGTDDKTPLVVVSREPVHPSLTATPGVSTLDAHDLLAAWDA